MAALRFQNRFSSHCAAFNASDTIPGCDQAADGNRRYVFPSSRGDGQPMCDNTIRTALKTLGYDSDVMTAHCFRTTASTVLNEQGWSPDAIERQLAHAPRDQVRAAYNRAQYLDERRRMMQA